MTAKACARAGAFFALLAVAAGAFGAHGLKDVLEAEMKAVYETAVRYQMYHALALLLVAALGDRISARALSWSGCCFVAGVVLFSGSLYALSLTGIRKLGAITPLGGLFFLAGWLALVLA